MGLMKEVMDRLSKYSGCKFAIIFLGHEDSTEIIEGDSYMVTQKENNVSLVTRKKKLVFDKVYDFDFVDGYRSKKTQLFYGKNKIVEIAHFF